MKLLRWASKLINDIFFFEKNYIDTYYLIALVKFPSFLTMVPLHSFCPCVCKNGKYDHMDLYQTLKSQFVFIGMSSYMDHNLIPHIVYYEHIWEFNYVSIV